MKYNFIRNGKDCLPNAQKMSHKYRIMMKRRAAKYQAKANGGRDYGKR